MGYGGHGVSWVMVYSVRVGSGRRNAGQGMGEEGRYGVAVHSI